MFKFTKHSQSSSSGSNIPHPVIQTNGGVGSSSVPEALVPTTQSGQMYHQAHTPHQHPHHHHHHHHLQQQQQQQYHHVHSNNQIALGSNQVGQFFEVGKLVSTAGPENVWKIYDGWRKADGKVSEDFFLYCLQNIFSINSLAKPLLIILRPFIKPKQVVSIFVFEKKSAEKLHKPKRKETITEILKSSVKQLERFRHPKILQVSIVPKMQKPEIFSVLRSQ